MNITTSTVEDMIAGSIDNMSQADIDSDLIFFYKTAKKLGVNKDCIDDMTAIIDDGYEIELDKIESPYVLDERNGLRFIFFANEETAEKEIIAQEERNAAYERGDYWFMVILKGDFSEHSKVIVKIDEKIIERKVYYSKADGLYILYNNRKYFFEEFSFLS